jgi:hypothetical protein
MHSMGSVPPLHAVQLLPHVVPHITHAPPDELPLLLPDELPPEEPLPEPLPEDEPDDDEAPPSPPWAPPSPASVGTDASPPSNVPKFIVHATDEADTNAVASASEAAARVIIDQSTTRERRARSTAERAVVTVAHTPPTPSSSGSAITKAVPRGISPARKRLAVAIAAASDLAQWFFFPAFVEGAASPFEVALDAVTALAILLVVGFQWRLAIALVAELVPGLDMFPTWTAVVLSLTATPPPALPPAPPRQPRDREDQ